MEYDVLVVGGRCAGSTLATLLARAGARVAVCERERLGTDQVVSTHTIHPAGMDVFDELGIGRAIREAAPPMRRIRLDVNGVFADLQLPAGRDECCPRRHRLDRLLQEAAITAGAEFHDRARLTGLLHDGERVVGARVRGPAGERTCRARLVVGADGRHSTVARLAGAAEYLGYNWGRGMYWAYWDPPQVWRTEAYPFDMLLRMDGADRRVIFSTDDGQLLLGTVPELGVMRRWHGHDTGYLDDLRADPIFRPLVDGGTMRGRVVGTRHERFFFRQAAGAGWALVGDAGHHKDPLIGWGISEGVVQAKQLAAAILQGGSTALQRYWRQRDLHTLPRYRLAQERGERGALSPLLPLVLSRASGEPALAQTLAREIEYDVNPYELLPVSRVARWVLGAALRGQPGLLRHFAAQARRVRRLQQELAEARRHLAAVPGPSLAGSG
jgi:menaquinone-9 beta-reductase